MLIYCLFLACFCEVFPDLLWYTLRILNFIINFLGVLFKTFLLFFSRNFVLPVTTSVITQMTTSRCQTRQKFLGALFCCVLSLFQLVIIIFPASSSFFFNVSMMIYRLQENSGTICCVLRFRQFCSRHDNVKIFSILTCM